MNDPTCPYIVQSYTTLTPIIVPDHLYHRAFQLLTSFTSRFLAGHTES